MPLYPRNLLPADHRVRRLSIAYLINACGTGLYFAGGALYFVHALHFSFTQVGSGLSVAALIGLLAGIPLGQAADRWGAPRVYALMLTTEGVATGSYVLISGFTAFLVSATVVAASLQGGGVARSALVPTLAAPRETARVRSYLTAVGIAGITLGAAAAGGLIEVGTVGAYHALMLLDTATFFVAALLIAPLHTRSVRSGTSGFTTEASNRRAALRDIRYLMLTGLNSIMTLQYQVLNFALPLWIVGRTHAPHWMVSGVLIVNTILVVTFQVRLSRGVTGAVGAAAAVSRAGVALSGACLLFGAVAWVGAGAAVILLIVGGVLHTFGEMWQSNGSFSLSYLLAPEDAHGQYQGVYSLSTGTSAAIAPFLLTLLCLDHGFAGWALLGVVFLLTGSVTVPAARRAWRQRQERLTTA